MTEQLNILTITKTPYEEKVVKNSADCGGGCGGGCGGKCGSGCNGGGGGGCGGGGCR